MPGTKNPYFNSSPADSPVFTTRRPTRKRLSLVCIINSVPLMEMSITTPGLLFPAISLLLLAYTNRFVTLASVIRQLSKLDQTPDDLVRRQVVNLRQRLQIIRAMQAFGVVSFLLCTLATFALFLHLTTLGKFLFGASLVLLSISLVCSLWEVQISTRAINIEIERLDR